MKNNLKEFKRKEKAMVDDIVRRKEKILADWSEAYVAETGLLPSECEMVEQLPKVLGGEAKYFFRRRDEPVAPALEAYRHAYQILLDAPNKAHAMQKIEKTIKKLLIIRDDIKK